MKGYLDHRIIKGAIFYICTICLLLGMVSSVLAIWDVLDEEGLHRALGTLAVIAFGSLLFMGINLAFGTIEPPTVEPHSPQDSAFADRLKKAKEMH